MSAFGYQRCAVERTGFPSRLSVNSHLVMTFRLSLKKFFENVPPFNCQKKNSAMVDDKYETNIIELDQEWLVVMTMGD